MPKFPNFPNVPADEGTRILSEKKMEIDSIPALFQKWSFDGITAYSAIFRDEDVVGYGDEELFQKIKDNIDVGPDTRRTIVRGEAGYTLVNFKFSYF
jgi:hypothetical protein